MSEAGSSREHPRLRRGARVLLLDAGGRLLLVRVGYHVPGTSSDTIWMAPGGEVAEGESWEDAARRELREETGFDVPLGPWVWRRQHTWRLDEQGEERGTWFHSRERFYLARIDTHAPRVTPPSGDLELLTLGEWRWWTLSELRATDEPTSPRRLAELLAPLVRGEVPAEPVDTGP